MRISKILTTIVFILILITVVFSPIDTVMQLSTAVLVLIYWKLEDIFDKLD